MYILHLLLFLYMKYASLFGLCVIYVYLYLKINILILIYLMLSSMQ